MNLGRGFSISQEKEILNNGDNLGRGFSISQEKEILKNGDIWIPPTPDKSVVQRSSYVPVEMQQTPMGVENWSDLLGMYTGLLQDETGDELLCKLNPCDSVGLHHRKQGRDVARIETYNGLPQNVNLNSYIGSNSGEKRVQDVTFVETYNRLPQSFNSTGGIVGQNRGENNNQVIVPVEKFRILNQNAGSVSSYGQNLGEIVPPQKVGTLAELMGMNKPPSRAIANGMPNKSVSVIGNHTIINPQSQVESNWKMYASARPIHQQNHVLHENQDLGGHNLQVPNNRLSVPCWADCNLNLPQIIKARTSSSVGKSFQIEPATPDQQKQMKSYQLIKVPTLSVDEISTQEKGQQDNIVFSQHDEIIERNHNELDTLRTSSATLLTTANENIHFDGGNGGIDLNKTPQQKPPKRRKHRPKVVVEVKPKKTPKPAAPMKNTPDKNPTGKRKYVRRTSTKTSTTPLTDVANEIEASRHGSAVKSCRRGLNFDLENVVENKSQGSKVSDQAQGNKGSKVPLGSDNAESLELNKASTTSTVKTRNITENLCNFVHSVNHIPPEELLQLATTPPPPTSIDHTLNIIARTMNAQNASANQNGGQNRYSQIHQRMSGDLAQLVTETNTNEPNLDRKRQPIRQIRTQLMEDLVDVTENRGAKRDYYHIEPRHPQTVTPMSSQLWSLGASKSGHANSDSIKLQQCGSETSKRKKIEEVLHATSSSMSSWITAVEDCSGQMESRLNKSLHVQSSALCLNNGLPSSNLKGKNTSRNLNNDAQKVACHWYMNSKDSEHKFQQQHISSQIHSCGEQMAQKTSHHLAQAQSTNSLTAVTNWNLESVSQRDTKTQGNGKIDSPAYVSGKSQTAGRASGKVSSVNNVLQQEIGHSKGHGHSSKKVTGSQEQGINLFSVDYITDRLKDLDINNNGKEIVRKEQSALVPYKGDGAIVTYEEFNPIKKRQLRPKVDLDPETNRLWNFLMGKPGSESEETIGDDRQKWWEEERKVLRNRADSFIARMHLVQGDRRFSKWKGSVVDSVIGVFLTQNVSDHLSSSAFMSLAAKFPLKSAITQACCQNGGGPSVEQHKVCITYPDGTTSYDYRITREPVYHTSPVTSSESSEYGAENVVTGRRTILINDHTKRTEEDMISSQSSSESVVFQASEDIKSSSGSNSEAEDQITGWNFSKNHGPLSFSEQVERIAAFKQYQFQVKECSFPDKRTILGHQQLELPVHGQNPGLTNGRNARAYSFPSNVTHHSSSSNISTSLEKWEADILAFSGNGNISSLVSTDVELTNGTGKHAHVMSGQSAESNFTAQQTGRPKFSPSTANHANLREHFEQKTDLSSGSQSGKGQHFINYSQGGSQETFQQEIIILTDTDRPIEDTNNLKCPASKTPEPTEMRPIDSSGSPSRKMGTTTSHASKQKAEKEKVESFNWDTLRTKVQSEIGKRERSRDTMDSLDYEALRNADVREISETIKERGMNNMLAERIKDFLNRLVREHEEVDLEWLRDVQPDKVKDYLLSIRGLGLKSVECVRLLTLHNVAFPVDTNVGRIAVRLGWVPLRPLPESLQLHLLELYPVLESIQKYLWPRLCHLNQETLYELHYQMITFGKVFCTKRDPNCNACPMRGDCRHFASAYASARLALPGPDERRVVCSDAPTGAKKISNMIKNPMPLPPAEDNLEKGTGLTRNCEPIIEEPTTPEPPTEVPEKDIEDAFYEDPNEIPVIKLNIEAFTTNLQSIMQEQQEVQGDMSKALVALSQEFASIPMPKLKHVSRLRTEHQVYELPDSHPLLKELDKREPDDPSPYLLAIWTPGETADSVQPPESKCNTQELGGLCEKKTCFSCSSSREAQAQTVRGTILIPCRTAMRGSFPLNGTYFQVNEVFADHESSMNPIDIPRSLLWNLPRRTVFFGTSVTTIFKGLTTEGIQYCFWKGFVCVRGFDQKTRAPRPLSSRLHHPASKMVKQNEKR